jgi:two-component system response regulator AtoC
MPFERALVVSGEAASRSFLAEVVRRAGLEVSTAASQEAALALCGHEAVDLVVSDMGGEGLELLRAMRELLLPPLCLFIAESDHTDAVSEAMRLGAFYCVTKPFAPGGVDAALARVKAHAALIVQTGDPIEGIVAESPMMKQLVRDLPKIARSTASVLITGESGTGKEVIAQAIHRLSLRAAAPFIKVNCAAIPDSLIESEFFGHERGAFTGAVQRRLGRFELADRGTLLLDEISEVPLPLQPKLLRAIQEQEFERVGGTHPIRVDVRFLATSNRNMRQAIEEKVFREDLYYRLNVVPLRLPPLRERREDIFPLAEHFLALCCAENHKPLKHFSQGAKRTLVEYPWPGNIRELANIIERTVVMDVSDIVQQEHLCLDPSAPPPQVSLSHYPSLTLAELEKRHILDTLKAQNNNRTRAAKLLGISVRTLRNKLRA